MNRDIQHLLITPGLTLHELLQRMDAGRLGILLLVDAHGRLVRTVTDGDLRRLLLKGVDLKSTEFNLPPKPPIVAPEGSSDRQLLDLMQQGGVNQIPLLDQEGIPVALVHLRDLDKPILLSTPHMGEQELDFVNQAFDTNWIAPLGPNVDAFERELADAVGVGHAAAMSSGTAAIHLALVLLGIQPGDRVLCSTFTFVASANPILYVGATPIFIDSEPGSWNLSPQALARALEICEAEGQLPKALVVVNLYGQSADMEPILALCERYGVTVVEDAAESLGATYRGKASGTFGRLGIYSFNGNKIITTSGGGMLISDDGALIEKARFLSTQARDPAPWYQHSQMGFNYRMSNVLAGIGRGQLRVLEERVDQRRAVFERYQASQLSRSFEWMPEADFGRATRWLSAGVLGTTAGCTAQELIEHLAKQGIEARRTWKPLHLQPLFAGCRYFPHAEGDSVSDRLFEGGVCLPSGSNMSAEQQERVIEAMQVYLKTRQAS